MNFSKKSICLSVMTAMTVLLSTTAVWAEDAKSHEMAFPKPTQEHAWLQQLVGKWDAKTEGTDPLTKKTVQATGSETVEALGGFWVTDKVDGTMMEQPFKGVMTLGYDADKKKYVGTWVDSVSGKLWQYEGDVDAAGKTLTLETEGECPMKPGKTVRFKETIEVQDKNHKTFTSSMLDDNGQWVTMMTSKATRK